MRVIRLCKVALVAAIAFFFTLVASGNIVDYGANWQFVQHVLSMDTTFPDSTLHWRAITDPSVQRVAYWLIIATQIVTAVTLWIGVLRLLAHLRSPAFVRVCSTAAAGLTLGILLYLVGFIAIGGEWFAMWQSQIWNGDMKALAFVAMMAVVLIILLLPEARED